MSTLKMSIMVMITSRYAKQVQNVSYQYQPVTLDAVGCQGMPCMERVSRSNNG